MRFASACAVCVAMICGCERHEAPPPATVPSSMPVQVAPATAASAEPAVFWIDQQPHDFPPALAVVKMTDEQVVVLLLSDDPPNAVNEDYQGNSFYLEMTPELAQSATLAGAAWHYEAATRDRMDSLNGVFLQGRKKCLQPLDVRVDFAGGDSPMKLQLSGQFLLFGGENDQVPPQQVDVRAELVPTVRIDSSGP